MTRKLLLWCGILSSILYVAINIFVAMQWKDYNSSHQTVSELSAIGAPTRSLWVVPGIIYTLLVTAFGWGVWLSAHQNRYLRVVACLVIAYGIVGIAWPFAPMHSREVLAAGGETLSDRLHVAFSVVTVLLMLFAIASGAAAFDKRFRFYSILTIVILLFFGALTFWEAPHVKANLPTPWIGVWERINIGVFLLWMVVLAVALLPERKVISAG